MNIFAFARRLLVGISALWVLLWICVFLEKGLEKLPKVLEIGLIPLAMMWAIAFGIGWAVRGLLSIPMGRDHK